MPAHNKVGVPTHTYSSCSSQAHQAWRRRLHCILISFPFSNVLLFTDSNELSKLKALVLVYYQQESPSFHSVERTLPGPDSVSTEPPALLATSRMGVLVIIDHAAPTTSVQLRLADGTSIDTQFNTHHTIRDVRGFIDASRPDDSKDYQLFIMGFPHTPLLDFDQTIEKAGIANNSVLIQKF